VRHVGTCAGVLWRLAPGAPEGSARCRRASASASAKTWASTMKAMMRDGCYGGSRPAVCGE